MTTPVPPRRPLTIGDMEYGAARSRRLLIETVKALAEFSNAVTVIGAHAVHVWVEKAWGPTNMESTRDGDLVIDPVFVTENPKLLDLMAATGITPALPDRPGIYGFADEADKEWSRRTTIDLIVPEAYAGKGRRAARIPGQYRAASRALGLELTVWDRHRKTLSTLGEAVASVDVHIAGPAALLVAKAHKVHERLAEFETRPDRLKRKDSGDVGLLMVVSDPAEVAAVMVANGEVHPEIEQVVADSARWLIEMYSDTSTVTRQHLRDSLGQRYDEAELYGMVDNWLTAFKTAAAPILP